MKDDPEAFLPKAALVHGTYYAGQCRNASVARWHAGAQRFVHWQHELGHRFLHDICHPDDEQRYDAFFAFKPITPEDSLRIPDDAFEKWTAQTGLYKNTPSE